MLKNFGVLKVTKNIEVKNKKRSIKNFKFAPIRNRFRYSESASLSDQKSPTPFLKSLWLPRYNELGQIS